MKTIAPVLGSNINEIGSILNKLIDKDIDIIELRADYLEEITKEFLSQIIELIRLLGFEKILLTLRSFNEGGKYTEDFYTEMIAFFLDFDIDYIDIEADSIEKFEAEVLVEKAKDNLIEVVFSRHKPQGLIKDHKVKEFYDLSKELDVAICKIVDCSNDMDHILYRIDQANNLVKEDGPDLISITMGQNGRISRIASNIYKPKYTFVNASDQEDIGQISLEESQKIKYTYSEIIFWTSINSPIGQIFLYSDGKKLTEIEYEKHSDKDGIIFIESDIKILSQAKDQLIEYFDGQRQEFDLDLLLQGTKKEIEIYKNLLKVPFGNTITYRQLAAISGIENGGRMCGNTMAKNKLPIIVPCHRVVKSDGSLGNYTGGVEKKHKLLEIEGSNHA